ncbi:MAG: hypothetical protein LKM37_03045 [Bacteroidales bacterium]|jgi:hypothetical protein|nr:hypothetical protein [Bacteroidales bacterium]MCI1732823.1 hypothetical protein [Bacteroidales bacterium]
MKTNFIGYSERGMMDALVFSFMEKPETLTHFLEKIKGLKIKDIAECELYLEHSLSEFGTPDLVIIVSHKDKDSTKDAIFVEAKVKAYGGLKKSESNFKSRNKYDGYSSNLFYQLYLKKLLFDNRENININININKRIWITDKYRKKRTIGQNTTVLKLFNKIVPCKNSYYVAIVPKLKKDIPEDVATYTNLNLGSINFISWDSIVNDTDENSVLRAVYRYNEGLIDDQGIRLGQ